MKQIKYIVDIGAEKSLVEFTDSTKIRIVESTNLIEHLNKQFSLSGVSQQRELLIAFANYIKLNNKKLRGKKTLDLVDYFIAINCG